SFIRHRNSIGMLADEILKLRGRRPLVDKNVLTVAQVAAAHRRVAAEFAGIGRKHRGAAIHSNGLPCLHFSAMEIEQAAIFIDAADTEDSEINLETRKELNCCLADDVAVERSQHSSCDGDFDLGIACKGGSCVKAVGYDAQTRASGQCKGDVRRR